MPYNARKFLEVIEKSLNVEIGNELYYGKANILPAVEENIVNDRVPQPAPKFLNFIQIRTVGRKEFQV